MTTFAGGLGSGFAGTLPPGASRERRDALERIAKSDVCAVCDAGLTVAMQTDGSGFAIRCGACNTYGPDTRPRDEPSPERRFQRYLRGDASAAPNLIETQQLDHRLRKRINAALSNGTEPRAADIALLAQLEAMVNQESRALVAAQPRAIVAPEEAEQQVARYFSGQKLQGLDEQRREMARIISLTGLLPSLGEIMIYEKAIFIPADGWRKVINSSNKFDGMPEPPKYLSVAEKEQQGIPVQKIAVRIALQRKGQRFPVYAIGIADAKAPHRGNQPVEVLHPQIMAETRAYRRACRMGFQDVLSGFGLDAYADPEGEDAAVATVRVVDVETGQITEHAATPTGAIEGQYREAAPSTPQPIPPTGLTVCPLHKAELQANLFDDGAPGHFDPDSEGGWCDVDAVINDMLLHTLTEAGLKSKADLDALLTGVSRPPWEHLSREQRVMALPWVAKQFAKAGAAAGAL